MAPQEDIRALAALRLLLEPCISLIRMCDCYLYAGVTGESFTDFCNSVVALVAVNPDGQAAAAFCPDGNLLLQALNSRSCVLVPMRQGFPVPAERHFIILRDAGPELVHPAEPVLRPCVSFIRGFQVPSKRLCVIPCVTAVIVLFSLFVLVLSVMALRSTPVRRAQSLPVSVGIVTVFPVPVRPGRVSVILHCLTALCRPGRGCLLLFMR